MVASRDLRRALTRHLRVQPVDAQKAYEELLDDGEYVRLLEDPELLAEDPVDILLDTIDLQPAMPTVQLLSGFRGTGKTTALLRLRDRLRDAGYAAIRVDVKDYLSTEQPLEAEEFLLFMAAAAVTEAQAQGLIPAAEQAGLAKRVRAWFDRVQVTGATFEVGGDHATLALELGLADADRLAALRRSIAGRTREFAREVAADLEDLRAAVTGRDVAGLVLIVDSVEQYRGTHGSGGTAVDVQRAMNRLFSVNADLLDPRVAGLHLVYTVPPYLKWLAPGLGNRFEPGGLSLVPAVKVRDKAGAPFEAGTAALLELVNRRIGAALAEHDDPEVNRPEQIILPEAIERLALRTGGVVRELIRAVQGVVTRLDDLPVPDAIVDRALRRIEAEYELVDEDVAMLSQIRSDGPPPIADAEDGLALWARQLDVGNVLCYENGEEWYVVNPLVADRVARRAAEMPRTAPTSTTPSPEGGDETP